MKVVVLGGNSCSTPVLWLYLINEAQVEDLNVVLAGRNAVRLNAVKRACELLGTIRNNSLETAMIGGGNWRFLHNADLVLIQIRNGGYTARACDETFPLRYGVIGDEGLGPGGLCAAIRNWKVIQQMLEAIATFSPHAFVLMMSSPVGLLVRAAACKFPRINVTGICELPWTTLLNTCRVSGLNPDQVRFDYFGINHLGWLYDITENGRTVSSVVPLKYLRLHELRNTVLEEQRQASQPRAAALAEISRIAFEIYEHGDAHQIRRAAEMRAAPWYPHAIGPVIAALDGSDVRTTFFLSAPNHGFDSAYRDDDILEYAYTAERRTLVRAARINRVPAEMRRTLWPFIEFERTATKAVLSPKVANVEESLRIHPWVMDCVNVNEMAREVLNYAHAA